jgi:hypothetical protein
MHLMGSNCTPSNFQFRRMANQSNRMNRINRMNQSEVTCSHELASRGKLKTDDLGTAPKKQLKQVLLIALAAQYR